MNGERLRQYLQMEVDFSTYLDIKLRIDRHELNAKKILHAHMHRQRRFDTMKYRFICSVSKEIDSLRKVMEAKRTKMIKQSNMLALVHQSVRYRNILRGCELELTTLMMAKEQVCKLCKR